MTGNAVFISYMYPKPPVSKTKQSLLIKFREVMYAHICICMFSACR